MSALCATEKRRVRVGVIGCGSVSNAYLPHLSKCPYVELVSTSDIIFDRAERQSRRFNIANHNPHIDKMLAGAEFDLMVNLTDMQEHEHLNRQAIDAGKRICSRETNRQFTRGQLGDPGAGQVERPADLGRAGRRQESAARANGQDARRRHTLGRIASAHAVYGHTGPRLVIFLLLKRRRKPAGLGRLQSYQSHRPFGPGPRRGRHGQHYYTDARHSRQRHNQSD